jgi:nicotinamidase-related amidase
MADLESIAAQQPGSEGGIEMANILPNTDRGLLTAESCALVFVDHQPQMAFGVGSGIDRQLLVNNVLLLAKGAKLFDVPTILTTVETESFSGSMWPQLLDVFPQQKPIERTGMNAWDTPAFREAIKATGKKNILFSGLWTEVCIAWPTLNMLSEGYNIYVVEDACAGTSAVAHEASLCRMTQAGAVRMTTVATVLEFQRDWANRQHYDALMDLIREHGGAYGIGVEYAYTMVHKAPAARKILK